MNELETKINKDLILRENLAMQRTHMANQTTLLAFIRTSLYFLIGALSLESLLKLKEVRVIEISFFVISFVILTTGILNYFKQRRLILNSEKHIGNYKLEYIETSK
ncbi:DUF202 domain-containing protein [Aurantibacillus circumpalustris]|uniref:DUF202 domain-containing protein n=1 Tax=Aurantibacillus circumpalustris TaxID=3036359 RepID=UPI00295B4016|nr:DUF202 domain-containing protein [Aurantibacillus circumpalustris]